MSGENLLSNLVWYVQNLNINMFSINYSSLLYLRAKLKYCSFWPAMVVPTPDKLGKTPKNKICVMFFGSKTL